MPIFISYSHADKDFVDSLARQLVQNSVSVWLDRWELRVGDSLLSKVQEAITGASALLVILSETSVNSTWVQREMTSGILRELEERRVVVLPILIEDCQIPLFLRDKLYADFRQDFDSGLRAVLDSVAGISNSNTGRIDDPQYHSDWAFTWGVDEGDRFAFFLTIIERAHDQPYSVLANVDIFSDMSATRTYNEMVRTGREEEAHRRIIQLVVDKVNTGEELVFVLEDQFRKTFQYRVQDEDRSYVVRASAQRLGIDTGRDVLYRAGSQLRQVLSHMNDVAASGTDGGA